MRRRRAIPRAQLNSSETERPSWMCVMAVAICGASDKTSIFDERFSGGIGMVLVTSKRVRREAARRSMALPDSTGWMMAAETERAPRATRHKAAPEGPSMYRIIVPASLLLLAGAAEARDLKILTGAGMSMPVRALAADFGSRTGAAWKRATA